MSSNIADPPPLLKQRCNLLAPPYAGSPTVLLELKPGEELVKEAHKASGIGAIDNPMVVAQ